MFGLFYIPLWISIIINFYLYVRVSIFLNKNYEESPIKSVLKKMTFYPLILIIISISETIYSILYLFGIYL